ncbi:hypothetical protein FQZ97_1211060 [compost metagenome]
MQLFAFGRAEVVHQHLRHVGGDVFAALLHGADGGHQLGGLAGLVQVAARAGAQAADGVLVFRVHGDHQGLDR